MSSISSSCSSFSDDENVGFERNESYDTQRQLAHRVTVEPWAAIRQAAQN